MVVNGVVVPGAPSVNLATTDFTASNGDSYPFRGAPQVVAEGGPVTSRPCTTSSCRTWAVR
jgi:hypothetical protein